MPLPSRLTFVALACAALLAVAGCGSDEEEPASSTPEAASTPAATKPEVTVPEGKAPKKLVIEDIEEGTGAAAEPGQTVDVHYVGVSYLNGLQFDASWDRGEPFSFQLGAGSVIQGWDRGVAGMKVGGRRQLVIPPRLAYGPQGSPPAIGPNETLVFVIDLLGVQ
ncbi:MAG TPA: FKBP-type peptidyl-prolyl cis-trans isomerase [Solirubrobacteraceae bacterium]|nr:FKBP-type peptidyl-prolyl cis-trans isomerase [Solirubrobacteraceae bacterium]